MGAASQAVSARLLPSSKDGALLARPCHQAAHAKREKAEGNKTVASFQGYGLHLRLFAYDSMYSGDWHMQVVGEVSRHDNVGTNAQGACL